LVPWVLVIGVPGIVLLVIPPVWEFSNSAGFCGTTCHTMPPEYSTYLVSPHARIPCVDCHIGRGPVYEQLYRKTDHLRLIWETITGDYEYPIRVSTMRPARETCELCHYPQKFSSDSLQVIHRFADDEQNTPYDLYLLMHTGGGTQREGLGRGIHWHIENKIEYIATDSEEQDIPWVRVNYADGTTTEYVAADSTIDTANLGQYDIKEMDCITCHNRISHLIDPPDMLVDAAMYRGDLPGDIPYIRARAVEVLSQSYTSDSEAEAAIAKLADYYRTSYPDFYAQNSDHIAKAVDLIQQLYQNNTYSEQELDWETHPNNIGHRDSPGCFRCHDGQHFDSTGTAVRLECNLCHSIPQVVLPGEIEPTLPLTTGIEPSSHFDSTWSARHFSQYDATCSDCHTMDNPGGTTDTSFCSNSACHGVNWRYAGFNAPVLAEQLGITQQPEVSVQVPISVEGLPITYQTLQPFLEQQCGKCHGVTPIKGLRVTTYAGLMAGGIGGPVVVPGDPDNSRVLSVLSAGHFAQLPTEQMDWLRQWIEAGAPEGEPALPVQPTATPGGIQGPSFWATGTPTTESGGAFWGGAEATSTAPASAPPTSAPPTSVPPTSAPSTSAPTVQPTTESGGGGSFWSAATPTSTLESGGAFWGGAEATSTAPASAPPTSVAPTSAPPTSAPPTSAPPTSAPSVQPTTGSGEAESFWGAATPTPAGTPGEGSSFWGQ
jgi:hypothetical protein